MSEERIIPSLRERLLKERMALLDLSARNRLLNTPLRTRNNRAIEIVEEKSVEVFRHLTEVRSMTFLPGVQLSEAEQKELPPKDIGADGSGPMHDGAGGPGPRHADHKLQTRLTSETLQKRLFDIWYDARTLEEEQGVNILYLAVGLLRWFDKENSDLPRHAPLILLPGARERSNASEILRLNGRG
jgi:hypothetical protein